jgi:hypothetical protein
VHLPLLPGTYLPDISMHGMVGLEAAVHGVHTVLQREGRQKGTKGESGGGRGERHCEGIRSLKKGCSST